MPKEQYLTRSANLQTTKENLHKTVVEIHLDKSLTLRQKIGILCKKQNRQKEKTIRLFGRTDIGLQMCYDWLLENAKTT